MIIPGILEQTVEEIKEKIILVDDIVPTIQVDVCDGLFVPEGSFSDIKKLEEIEMHSDIQIHLMVKDIDQWIDKKIKNVKSICMHFECNNVSVDTINKIKAFGYDIGLSINPNTNPFEVEPIIENFDFVQLMSVYPGKQGQKFLTKTLDKFKKMKEKHPNIRYQFDGGVNENNLKEILSTGIDNLVVGSAIFKSYNPKQKLIEFIQTAYGNTNIKS